MSTFEVTETVVLGCTVKDSTGTLADPATSMAVTVRDPAGTVVVSAQAMTQDSTGTYHYDYTSAATALRGEYVILYTATDGTRISTKRDTFVLE